MTKFRAEDQTEEEINAMSDEEIMALDETEIPAETPAPESPAVEDVVAVVDQRQMLVEELATLDARRAEINAMIAQMDAAVVPLISEAVEEPAIVATEPDPATAETPTEEEQVQARRRRLIAAVRRAA